MAQRTKGSQVSFRVEDDLARAIQEAADLEEMTLADFVRRVFGYGFHKYRRSPGGLLPLLMELREERLQAENGDGGGDKHRRKTDKK
jgi:DNA-binding PadR family transcriptional regulator